MGDKILCYRCQTEMICKNLGEISVDFCQNCQSYWLNSTNLNRLSCIFKHIENNYRYKPKRFSKVLQCQYIGMCPVCGCSMKDFNFKGIILDSCTSCNGIFFDHRELYLYWKSLPILVRLKLWFKNFVLTE